MSVKLITVVWDSAPFEGATLLTLIALADSSSDEGWSWPALKTLAKKARQPERTTYQSIKNLIESGWLEKHTKKEEKKVYFRVVIPATIAETSATIAKIPATIAKPPHPLKGRTVIEPSKGSRPSKEAVVVATTSIPAWLDADTWAAFCEMRKSIKHPMTPYAEKLMLAKLERFAAQGISAKGLLERSIVNNWRDVFPEQGNFRGAPASVKLVETEFKL